MESANGITRQQAEDEMQLFKKVFTVVRLLDGEHLEQMHKRCKLDCKDEKEKSECYEIWNKDHPCENCTSLQALYQRTQKTKLEFIEDELYQVTSRYIKVDGRDCVMELVKYMEMDTLVDSRGCEKLVNQLIEYDQRLYKDALTGVYNRRYFEEQIKKKNENAGVAVIDMDDFKLCNDTLGHSVGDAALRTMVKTVKHCIRKTDILIRYGGDEFILILENIKKENFFNKLVQIQSDIHAANVPGFPKLQLSVSIGGVISSKETVEHAVMQADKLMYQAKEHKNMVVTEDNASYVAPGVANRKARQQILIVDDSEMNRAILSEMLKKDFDILEAENGKECLDILQQYGMGISLVLLDIVMPVVDGFEVLDVMVHNHWIEDIPVIMISSEDSEPYIRRAYELGVSDYINRPFDAKVVCQRVYNTIKLYAKQRKLVTLVTDQIYEKEKNNQMMISILSQIVEFRNGESGLHVLHINILSELLLERLVQKTDKYQISAQRRSLITMASALHDIGKIGIDDKILNKPGRLTQEEFDEMKKHTIIGESILKNVGIYQNEELVQLAMQICRWHHERYDGRGYPDGLKGEEIPIEVQVVSIADVYDALVSERVYKKAYSHKKAVEMILNGECGQFNPLLLECLQDIQDRIDEEFQNVENQSEEENQERKVHDQIMETTALG